MATRPTQPAPYPNIFINEKRGMSDLEYLAALRDIDALVDTRPLSPLAVPSLIRESANALRLAVESEPPDHEIVHKRAIALAADALRAIRALGEAGQLGSAYVSPTIGRLPALIEAHAPRVEHRRRTVTVDPGHRWADEILAAADGATEAQPGTISGSRPDLARGLYRIVAIAAREVARTEPATSVSHSG